MTNSQTILISLVCSFLLLFILFSLFVNFYLIDPNSDPLNKKDYSNIQYKKPLIISLSSIPSRIKKSIKYIEDNIKKFPKDAIIEINVPYFSKRLNKEYPEVTTNCDKIKIYRVDEDLGPITKILPTLERHVNDDCFIVSIDDDQKYPVNYIEKIYKRAELDNFGSVITCSQDLWSKVQPNVCGFAGVGYPSKIVNAEDLANFYHKLADQQFCVRSDDFVISLYLFENNIRITHLKQLRKRSDNKDIMDDPLKYAKINDDEAEKYIHKKNYEMCYDYYMNLKNEE
jgi:hypothetical protein